MLLPRSRVRGSLARRFRQQFQGTHPGDPLSSEKNHSLRQMHEQISRAHARSETRDPGAQSTAAERCEHVSPSPRSGRAPTGGLGPRREAPATASLHRCWTDGPNRAPHPLPSGARRFIPPCTGIGRGCVGGTEGGAWWGGGGA